MHKSGSFKHKLMALLLAGGGIVAQPTQAYYSPSLAWDLSIGAGYYLLSDAVLEESIKSSKKATKKSTKQSSKKSAKSAHTKQSSSKSSGTKAGNGKQNSTSGTSVTTSAAVSDKADEFRYSSKISTQVTDEMVVLIENHLKANNAYTAQAQKELKQLKSSQLIQKVRQALKSEGYNPNSLATAMAYWVVINYGIASGQELAKLQGHTLVAQLKSGIHADASLAAMSDSEKQTISDYLYWLASLKIALHSEAVSTNNRQAINNSSQQAHQALRDMGLSVSMLGNGSGGVEIR